MFFVSEDQSSHPPRNAEASGETSTPSAPLEGGAGPPAGDTGESPVVPPPDAQKTVISKRQPASPPAFKRATSPFELGQALEGRQLGHFKLEQFVGGGGMGAVFRATDTMLGRTVAVKVVSGEQTDEETLKRFRNEAQSAARFDHPNIARVYYVGEDHGWNYIVFEFIEGINVRDLVDQRGPLSLEDTVTYTLQIAEALDHAWQREVIHRDIKPSNILVLPDGRAKLVDMGLARFQQVESAAEDLTASGVTLGTFDYISPEQARDPRTIDVRSDLYSLGCTMFYMLSGQPPFPHGTVLQKLLSHSSDEPPDLREIRPDIGDEVAGIIDKLLTKTPEQRFQSPSELIGQLILAADHLGLSNVSAGSTVWITPRRQRASFVERHLPWLAPLVTLVAIVLMLELLSGPASPVDIPQPQFTAGVFHPSGGAANQATLDSSPVVSDPSELPQPQNRNGESSKNGSDPGIPSTPGTPIRQGEQPGERSVSGEGANSTSSGTSPDRTIAEDRSESVPETEPPAIPKGPVPSASSVVTDAGEASLANGPRADSALPLEQGPRFIVVSDEEVDLDATSLRVESLNAALQTAAALSTVEEIELRFNGTRMLRPIELRLDNAPNRSLLIRAATGYDPLLAFDPSADSSWPGRVSSMFQLHGGQLTWADVHFHLRVPPSNEWTDSWTLFQLHAVNLLEFRHCTMTLQDLAADGTAVPDNAVFVRIPSSTAPSPIEPNNDSVKTKIWLEHCIARGQATLVQVENALPIQLFWHHGAFFSTQSLVTLKGSEDELILRHGRSHLDLQRLFAATRGSLCRLDANRAAPHLSGLATNCFDCLFAAELRDAAPSTPVYRVHGGETRNTASSLLDVNGSNNFYRQFGLLAEFLPLGVEGEVRRYTFADVKTAAPPHWFHERSPQMGTVFSWPDPRISVDQQTLDDYIGKATDGEALTYILGIEPTQLPNLPAANVSDLDRSYDWDPSTDESAPRAATVGSASR